MQKNNRKIINETIWKFYEILQKTNAQIKHLDAYKLSFVIIATLLFHILSEKKTNATKKFRLSPKIMQNLFNDDDTYLSIPSILKFKNNEFLNDIFAKNEYYDNNIIGKESIYEILNELEEVNIPTHSFDTLGNLYVDFLRNKTQVASSNKMKPINSQGTYYTPIEIASFIVNKTFKLYSKENNVKKAKINVIDLSCGSGRFLLSAINHFDSIQDISSRNHDYIITGYDIDPLALYMAQLNFKLYNQNVKSKVRHKDALFADEIIDDKYNIVIGNPPFIKGDFLTRNYHKKLKNKYFEIYSAEADYCFYFIKKAIDITVPSGNISLITPRYLLEATYGKKLREYILLKCHIVQIIDFGNIDIFEGIGSRCCILFLVKKSQNISNLNTKVIKVTSRNFPSPINELLEKIDILSENKSNSTYIADSDIEIFVIDQEKLDSQPWNFIPPKLELLFNRTFKKFSSLKKNQVIIGRGGITGSKIFTLPENEVINNNFELELWKPNLKNAQIKPYRLHSLEEYVFFGEQIESIEELSNFPLTLNYLVKYLKELAFLRKDFQPKKSKLGRKVNNVLKQIGLLSIELKSPTVNDVKLILKKTFDRKQNENLKEYNDRIDNHFNDMVNIKCGLTLYKEFITLNTNSPDFHNFWQWWKWTSPRNLHIIGLSTTPILVAPYIAPKNQFMLVDFPCFNASGDVLGIKIPSQTLISTFSLLGLLNSTLYNFLYQLIAKKKDYRFEYYPLSIQRLPLPTNDDFENSKIDLHLLDTIIQDIVYLERLNQQYKEKFNELLIKKDFDRNINFIDFYKLLKSYFGIKCEITTRDIELPSTALKIIKSKNKIQIQYYQNSWKLALQIYSQISEAESILDFVYLALDHFIDQQQKPGRKSWRKGKIISKIINSEINFPWKNFKNNKWINEIINFMDQFNQKEVINNLSLSNIHNKLIKSKNKINQLIYTLYNVSLEEQKEINVFLKEGIPYLP
ncbi:MAG: HsdM family class I SAM-dependent methyltransferase [Candidatus Hodarchaeales archaeon]|jgi:adenine-specific DNA-methyltransferase